MRYKIPKEIPVVFHNGSTYDYHFIVKELANGFEGNFECLGENTEKYITFSVPIKKTIDNKDLEITYKIKFIDSYRFMSSSLSKLVDNLSEGIHNDKCSDCESNLDYIKIKKNGKLLFKCFNYNIYYKVLMYEFWYDYMKPKYANNVKLCYMDTDSFIMNIKTNDFYKDISNDVENRFDTSNYEVKRPLPTGKNKKVIGLMKDELGGKIITKFVTLRPKTYSFLTDDGKEDKKAKGTKKCIIKKMIKFNDYKKCLLDDEVILKSQQRFVSKKHDVYTENINKIALSNNNDKRIVSSNKISSYPYGYTL